MIFDEEMRMIFSSNLDKRYFFIAVLSTNVIVELSTDFTKKLIQK